MRRETEEAQMITICNTRASKIIELLGLIQGNKCNTDVASELEDNLNDLRAASSQQQELSDDQRRFS